MENCMLLVEVILIEIFYQTNNLFIYDPLSDRWIQGADMPIARGALTASFIKGILYVVGGVNSTETLTITLAYDPISNKWTEKAPMPTVREHLTSSVVNWKLYVIG